MPWPRKTTSFPKHWPPEIARYWMQAQRSLEGDNWDAAALMARSALQLLLRHEKATGNSWMKEIDDLAGKGMIPPVVREWAHELRVLGNDAAHPSPGATAVTAEVQAMMAAGVITMARGRHGICVALARPN